MTLRMGRRRFLLLGLAGAGTVLLASIRGSGNHEELIVKILRHYIPLPNDADSVLNHFATDYARKIIPGYFKMKAVILAPITYFSPTLRKMAPLTVQRRIEDLDRGVITAFILHTNAVEFFDGKARKLLYGGMPRYQLCNPFRTFRTPSTDYYGGPGF
jgi:hypothetical protein